MVGEDEAVVIEKALSFTAFKPHRHRPDEDSCHIGGCPCGEGGAVAFDGEKAEEEGEGGSEYDG